MVFFLPPQYDTVFVTYYFRLGINVIPTESGQIERFVQYVGRSLSTLSLSEGHCRRN